MSCQTLAMTTAMNGNPWKPADTLAARVLLVRTSLEMNRKQFADLTGLTENQLQSIESGRSPHQLAAKITRMVLATGVDRDWLMWGGPLEQENPRHPEGDGGEKAPSDGNNGDLGLKVRSSTTELKGLGAEVYQFPEAAPYAPVEEEAA